MDTKELEKIAMKDDGHDTERFQQMLKKVSTVSKEEVERQEKRQKEAKQDRPKPA